ncbi:uncharacterized protein K460DRAFT_91017 [Cucurbitaria berberidis CBS 394.84]|uniref:Uncharacterized protein n=1 Tax=Cucurbitaria berberidis CBS 394.84 TaxID=1168544 RepID=A0A9P4LCJ7_9PLEO|nr:uncharacterized protein K460DRAFT_91017 [Cucurbitaria berberidis CBS 394.84]KAF1849442.1 hypothetical protein K460DRAFT_91017 [Cucurbitaria berberidis CBS 394.84]
MDSSRVDFHSRAESVTSGLSLRSLQEASSEDENQFIVQVKKALAFCRRCTRISWSKSRAEFLKSIGLQSMTFTTPSGSRGCKSKPRPPVLRIGRCNGSDSHRYRLSPSFSYTASTASDPFITSPSWLKAEFSSSETIS